MTLSPDVGVGAALVERLLACPTPERRARLLQDEGLLHPEGLGRLLDTADRLINDDPGKARQLAELAEEAAAKAGAPAAVPRARYVRAGAHGTNSEFQEELRLIGAARDGYLALGEHLEALRTDVGLMVALLELGRYGEALEAGRAVLDALAGKGTLDVAPTREQADLLTALVNQNLGICYEYMGRYGEALDAYASAEEHYETLGMTERLGEISMNRGAVLMYLGRSSEALAAHEAAATVFREAGLALSHARALGNVAEALLHLGDYTSSLDAFERARHLLGSLDASADESGLLLDTAKAYLELNLYSEALSAYAELNGRLRDAGIEHDRAEVLWGMGSALIALSDFKEAERALRGAVDKFAAAGNAPMLSGVLLEQASLLAARGDREAALATARRALALLSEEDWPVQLVYAHLRLSDLLLPEEEGEAERHLLAARRLAERLTVPHLLYRLNERLGHLRRLQGRQEEARALLEAAVAEIERLRGTVIQETMRASFLRDKTAAYEDLILLHLDRRDGEAARRAFGVAEKAKSRALVDLLTSAPGGASNPSEDQGLEARLCELQAALNVTYNQILGLEEDEHEIPIPDLQGRAVELEREISRLRLRAAPTPDPFANTDTSEEDVLERLPPGVTLVAYHVVGGEIVAFVGAGGDLDVARNLGSVETVSELSHRLDIQWDRFRAGPRFTGRHAATLERSTRQILKHLYAALVAPLEPLLEAADRRASDDAARRVVVVPHGPLHRVPFHALFDGEGYLIERFEISYAPSARVYALCQEKDPRRPAAALVMGVADGLIPAVAEEIRSVARHFPDAEVLCDGGATADALIDHSPGTDVLHLACHGLFRSDNPMFSSLKLHDGWLTAADVLRLDLKDALVVLSACESGRSEVVGGDETIGLARAFLGAGAATLVTSLWLVQDETTADLMDGYYERLRGGAPPAEALRAAQLALKREYPHPHYWAPFVLVGRGQRASRRAQKDVKRIIDNAFGLGDNNKTSKNCGGTR